MKHSLPLTTAPACSALSSSLDTQNSPTLALQTLPHTPSRSQPIWCHASPIASVWLNYFLQNTQLFPLRAPSLINFARIIAQQHGCQFTWHALRRGGASELASLGAPQENIALWGRWKSLSTVHHYIEKLSPMQPAQFWRTHHLNGLQPHLTW